MTATQSDVDQIRLVHQVELLDHALYTLHRLDNLSLGLERLVDLARQATLAPYALLIAPTGVTWQPVDWKTSGKLPDEAATATLQRVAQLLEQVGQQEPPLCRFRQFPVSSESSPVRWNFSSVAIFRREVVAGLLGVVAAGPASLNWSDELRMLELLARCAGIALNIQRS